MVSRSSNIFGSYGQHNIKMKLLEKLLQFWPLKCNILHLLCICRILGALKLIRITKQLLFQPRVSLDCQIYHTLHLLKPNSFFCRHMFFLHIKEDLLAGNLQCSSEHAIELSALLAQVRFGDYNQNTAKYSYEELCAKELTTATLER